MEDIKKGASDWHTRGGLDAGKLVLEETLELLHVG